MYRDNMSSFERALLIDGTHCIENVHCFASESDIEQQIMRVELTAEPIPSCREQLNSTIKDALESYKSKEEITTADIVKLASKRIKERFENERI